MQAVWCKLWVKIWGASYVGQAAWCNILGASNGMQALWYTLWRHACERRRGARGRLVGVSCAGCVR
eukprot:577258-Pyramimonas_sp.AAC.1